MSEPAPSVVILHGWENRRPPGHWEYLLAEALRADGVAVAYPQLPDPDEPDLDTWLAVLDELVGGEGPSLTLVAHSLATSLWLTRLARGAGPGRVSRLALVAIPSPAVLASTVVAPFVDHPRRIDAVPGIEVRVFEGEGDPYSPGGVRSDYTIDSSIPVELVPGGGHLIPDSGFGEWPRMRDWVRGDLPGSGGTLGA